MARLLLFVCTDGYRVDSGYLRTILVATLSTPLL